MFLHFPNAKRLTLSPDYLPAHTLEPWCQSSWRVCRTQTLPPPHPDSHLWWMRQSPTDPGWSPGSKWGSTAGCCRPTRTQLKWRINCIYNIHVLLLAFQWQYSTVLNQEMIIILSYPTYTGVEHVITFFQSLNTLCPREPSWKKSIHCIILLVNQLILLTHSICCYSYKMAVGDTTAKKIQSANRKGDDPHIQTCELNTLTEKNKRPWSN